MREAVGWGNTQLKLHLARLEELELIAVHHEHHAQRFEYELRYEGEGKDGAPFLAGLIDVEALGRGYDADRSGQNEHRSAPGRPPVGPVSGGGLGAVVDDKPAPAAKKARQGANGAASQSYVQERG